MICGEVEELIHGYLDNELDLVRTLEIEHHLEDCPACLRVFEGYQSVRSAIHRGSLFYEAPGDLRKRVRIALHQANQAESPAFRTPWRLRPIWIPLAAAALILLVSFPFLMQPSAEGLLAQEIVSAHVRSLMPGHLTDVLSSDQHTVKPWFNGKLDFSPPVVDLAAEGFPLIGGRLDYAANRAVAVEVYQRRRHLINLFLWPSGGTGNMTAKAFARNGYNVITWAQAGMTYWAVSDVNANDLREFVQLIRK
jgi:mycothiol system anti-sigma-R factor